MMVKICGITNLEDALAAAEGGASALGFNFHPPSPRYIKPEAAAGITARLPAGMWKVGVFVNEPPAVIEVILAAAGLDIAQLHGDEQPEALAGKGRFWKAFRVAPGFAGAGLGRYPAEAFLLDAPAESYGGSGETFDWNLVRGLPHKIILAGGLDATNVGAAIEAVRPWGVDACSRLESAPGRKDRNKVTEFIKAALAA